MTAPLSDAYADLLRNDLSVMIHKCFVELQPYTPYQHNWHIDIIAEKLMACFVGKIKRLIINIPPRHLKSICASVALPAWWLGHDPSAQIICASYGQELANRLALDCRNIMQTRWYQALFPRTRLHGNRQAVHDFTTNTAGISLGDIGWRPGNRTGVPMSSSSMIPPSPTKLCQKRSAVTAMIGFDGTIYSRLNNKKDGCIIIVMQRLHEDDLTGHVLGPGAVGDRVVSRYRRS